MPAAAVMLANIIGTGVFVKAKVMTANVGSPGMVLLVWAVAGVLTLTGAMAYAELGAMVPRAGGGVHFLSLAYGRLVAFMAGWTQAIAYGASGAAVSILIVQFLNDLVGGRLPDWALTVLPAAFLALATGLNLIKVRVNGELAAVLTAGKVVLVLAIAFGAFVLANGDWSHYAQTASPEARGAVPIEAQGGIGGFAAAMLGALWAYNGWQGVVALGGEVHRPGWTVPRAMIGGVALVIVLYLLINAAYFFVLAPDEVAGVAASSTVAFEAAQRFMGPATTAVMSACLVVSTYGTLHAGSLASSRLPFTIARSGMMPAALGRISRNGVPAASVIALGSWSALLSFTNAFDVLTDIYIFVLWIFVGLTGSTVFVLRRRMPDAPRPYRVWGYPVVPALFLLMTVFMLVNVLVAAPGRALAGLGLIASGLPVYWHYRRKLGPDAPREWSDGEEEDAGGSAAMLRCEDA